MKTSACEKQVKGKDQIISLAFMKLSVIYNFKESMYMLYIDKNINLKYFKEKNSSITSGHEIAQVYCCSNIEVYPYH